MPSFLKLYRALPERVRQQTRQAYQLFQKDPRHPSLHFKSVHPIRPIFSARVTSDYRVVGVFEGDDIYWFWVGPHADYDLLLKQL